MLCWLCIKSASLLQAAGLGFQRIFKGRKKDFWCVHLLFSPVPCLSPHLCFLPSILSSCPFLSIFISYSYLLLLPSSLFLKHSFLFPSLLLASCMSFPLLLLSVHIYWTSLTGSLGSRDDLPQALLATKGCPALQEMDTWTMILTVLSVMAKGCSRGSEIWGLPTVSAGRSQLLPEGCTIHPLPEITII